MPTTILRPQLLAYKNRLLGRGSQGSLLNREVLVILISIPMMMGVYGAFCAFLIRIQEQAFFAEILPARMISFSLYGFFLLLLISNCVTALGYFFAAKDMPLLLTLPITIPRLYLTRLTETLVSSSWMFVLFCFPAVLAYQHTLNLPQSFFWTAVAVCIPLLIIPAALSGILVTLLVNLVPAHRFRELIALLGFGTILAIMFSNPEAPAHLAAAAERGYDDAILATVLEDPSPFWMPSRWAADLLISYLGTSIENKPSLILLLTSSTLGITALGYLLFDTLFFRGWAMSTENQKKLRVEESEFGQRLSRKLLPVPQQFRSMIYKEVRMFVRDATQWLQLILLLLLTFIYLYNFRALQMITEMSDEARSWWQAILATSNIALGGCVASAIATRFVFPSVSFEGSAYVLVRSAPLSIKKLLRYKFLIWLLPITAVSMTLFISGAWAVQANPNTVALSAILAIALSIGIVGLGVGIGAVYAKFDWNSPTQVSASFGSLVFMLLSLAVIMVTLIPAGFLVILTTVPHFVRQFDHFDYTMAISCSYFLVVFINVAAARGALSAGRQALLDLEK